jgi:hypothetical protein
MSGIYFELFMPFNIIDIYKYQKCRKKIILINLEKETTKSSPILFPIGLLWPLPRCRLWLWRGGGGGGDIDSRYDDSDADDDYENQSDDEIMANGG